MSYQRDWTNAQRLEHRDIGALRIYIEDNRSRMNGLIGRFPDLAETHMQIDTLLTQKLEAAEQAYAQKWPEKTRRAQSLGLPKSE